jgi:hypothetical protein
MLFSITEFYIFVNQQKTCRSRFFGIEKQLNGLAEAQITYGDFPDIISGIPE